MTKRDQILLQKIQSYQKILSDYVTDNKKEGAI